MGKNKKQLKRRNVIVQARIARRGARDGFHTRRGYTRKVKHKTQVRREDD